MRETEEVEKEKIEERWILLSRFFGSKLYEVGKFLCISWFDQFDGEFEFAGTVFFHGKQEEKALSLILNAIVDEKLKEIFENFDPSLWGIDSFFGKYYTFVNDKFEIGSKQDKVREDVIDALSQVGERGYAFLKAIVDLYEEGRWDYGGAKFTDIVARMRENTGKGIHPSPMDYVIFNSYKIYYKTESNKYPTHTIPPEIITTVKQALEEYKRTNGSRAKSEETKAEVREKPKIEYCPLTGATCEKFIETQPNMYFVAHAFTKENIDDLRDAIKKALAETNLEPYYYADQEVRNQHILCKICEKIRCSQFGIFEISDGNPNVTLELGMAWGFRKTLLIVKKCLKYLLT